MTNTIANKTQSTAGRGVLSFLLLSSILFALLGACDNVIDPPQGAQAAGYGSVTVSFTSGAARTAFPAAVFESYAYRFTKTGGQAQELSPADGKFTLEPGTYTVAVEAYAGTKTPENLAAQGVSGDFTVSAGGATAVTVTLANTQAALAGTGTFKYTLSYPAGARADSLTMRKLPDLNPADDVSLTIPASGVETARTGVPSGFYLVTARFSQDGRAAGKSEVAHIYHALTTALAITLGGADFSLPAPVFAYTGNNNSDGLEFSIDDWAGQDDLEETWTLNARESKEIHFAVAKSAAQTLTVSGGGASLVTQSVSGTVDGSTASDTLSVFTVDTSAYDLMFEGGSRSFTLTAAESGGPAKTINVTLNTTPDLTGVAVYKVTRPEGDPGITYDMTEEQVHAWAEAGSLERVAGIKDYDPVAKAFTGQPADSLLDALVWVDQNAQTNDEYLARIEQDEVIPKILITCGGATATSPTGVTLRIRGAGTIEKIISFDKTLSEYKYSNGVLSAFGGISIKTSGNNHPIPYTNLILERNVTMTGEGLESTGTRIDNLVNPSVIPRLCRGTQKL